MASLLVTGAAGFIGTNFARHWLGRFPDDTLVALDALTYAGNRANLNGLAEKHRGFRFVHGDIADRALVEDLLSRHAIDTVVHFAAESHVDRSIEGPDAFIQTNVVGTHALLEAARKVWLNGPRRPDKHRFHHVSTDEVYGTLAPDEPAFTERTSYAPNSPYAASKAASDHLVRASHHTYGLEVTTSNCSNNYGPWHFPEKLIPLSIVNALTGKPLPIYGQGTNIRDWIYVEDHCRGVAEVVLRGQPGETYNLGGRCEQRNLDLVRALCGLIDAALRDDPALQARYPKAPASHGEEAASLITFVKDRPGHDFRYAINGDKAEAELGFAPRESLDSGLKKTVAWYLRNEAWWQAILDGSYRQQ